MFDVHYLIPAKSENYQYYILAKTPDLESTNADGFLFTWFGVQLVISRT
jgi:hypothetical protein